MRIKGIDVSKHQGIIDWAKVRIDGIEFAMIRVGYRGSTSGKINIDPYFSANINGALANNIDVGIYFYSTAISELEAEHEAEFVLDQISDYNITMPIVFDYEGYNEKKYRSYGVSKAQRTSFCKAFQYVLKANGYKCMLYGSQGHIRSKFDLSQFSEYLWVARYAGKNTVLDDEKYFPKVPGYQDRIAIWQCANNARVSGISGNVDLDYMYIDLREKDRDKEDNSMKIDSNTVFAYSKAKDGNKYLSKNFKAKEFACKDGSDAIFIAPSLVDILQAIRNKFGRAVYINSAYRTPSHNKKEGGSTYSQHLYGKAADIRITGVKPKVIAEYIETLIPDTGGIGIYKNFVHVDVRAEKSRWNE